MTRMKSGLSVLVLFASTVGASAQLFASSQCLPQGDYVPKLVSNPGNTVTFQCDRATRLDLIRAIGFQTRTPIGVVLGANLDALTRTTRAYDLKGLTINAALAEATKGTGYTIRNEDGVTVLVAGDLAPRQRRLLLHAYPDFGGSRAEKMACWGVELTAALRQAARPMPGIAVSCSTSPNDEAFTLKLKAPPTTEAIANAIVSQDSHGIWMYKVPSSPSPGDPTEELEILLYQHYSNKPITR